jgi:hypothetical protein
VVTRNVNLVSLDILFATDHILKTVEFKKSEENPPPFFQIYTTAVSLPVTSSLFLKTI